MLVSHLVKLVDTAAALVGKHQSSRFQCVVTAWAIFTQSHLANTGNSSVNYSWWENFHSMLWHCQLGDSKGIWPVKSWVLVCRLWWFDWSFAHLIASVITTTSIVLSSDKIQNLVLANPGPPGKWPLQWTERETLCRIKADCWYLVVMTWLEFCTS